MLGVGWAELVVVGAVALVAIGPKDMPKAMHALGRLMRKARAFMGEMHLMLEQASAEAEAEESLRKSKEGEKPKETEKGPPCS